MKKVLWLALVLTLALVMIAGCGDSPAEEAPVEEAPEEAPEEEVVETGSAKLGLGVVSSIAKSRDAGDDVTAQAQTDVVMAAVLFDGEGRVVSVSIDNAQNRVAFDEEMQLATDVSVPGTTKVGLGDDYGMKRVSEIEMEWYEQMIEFENWMLGQTVEEIKSLQVKVVDDAHQHVPDVPELTSTVTITVESYQAAVATAYENAK